MIAKQKLCVLQFDTITGTALLTDRQKTWRNITKQALSLKPIRLKRIPESPFKVYSLLPQCFVLSWKPNIQGFLT